MKELTSELVLEELVNREGRKGTTKDVHMVKKLFYYTGFR